MLSFTQTPQVATRLTQSLSPRLQYAVRLLQMSSLEFSQMLSQAADRNPFLETAEGDDEFMPAAFRPLVGDPGSTTASVPGELQGEPKEHHDAGPEHTESHALNSFDEPPEWKDGTAAPPRNDGDFNALDLMSCPTSLTTHLHAQLSLLTLDARALALSRLIVESLDDDGYLRCEPRDVLEGLGVEDDIPEEALDAALQRVQSLDPAGVGARSVQECLELQLGEIDSVALRPLAQRVLREHLGLLTSRDHAALARRLECSVADAETICREIRLLDPKPGLRFGSQTIQYVIPDVVARRRGGRWHATLNPAVVPKLKLNRAVLGLWRQQRAKVCPGLAGQLQEAQWTLRNVEQRFSTIQMVAAAILERQQNYLDYGEMAMRPLGLNEIAQAVGVHESTVSRATVNKYIATPHGVIELKHFFSRAMVMPGGQTCSGTAIRSLVRDIIASERVDQRLSDADITALLDQQGLKVARRTVTKYRQALRIEPVARRQAAGAA